MKCDDICFTHVLPRLSATDIKFLYGVNKETRKLVKRSTRAGDLKKKFNIGEMSSISTLEVARENKSSWPSHWWKTWFCSRVALTNKLELLKWAREEKKCKWDEGTIKAAAKQGNLEMVKYCVANECPIDDGSVCRSCPKRSSRGTSNTYAKKRKRLGIRGYCAIGRLQMVIFTYSNILLSVNLINLTYWRVGMQPWTATWTV